MDNRMLLRQLTLTNEEDTMKKLVWGLAAGFLLISAISLEAGEKRYRIQLASANGDVFGRPVSFQEVLPAPEPVPVPEPGQPIPPAPTPVDPPGGLQPIPDPYSGSAVPPADSFQTVELYPHVRYKDLHNIHPRAVKKIVAVKDPRFNDKICGRCAPPCVYIMICVPPSGHFKFEVKRKDYSKVEYDYGDYEVEISSKKGIVTVDYDD
jgi:hypothetical protein